jgi:CHAT domain-containing protein
VNLADALGLPELLRDLPGQVRHLTFVPDDQLHGFPFAAIPLGPPNQNADYLGLRWTTSISFAADASAGSSRSRVRTAVIAGAAHAEGHAPLPEVSNQCEALAGWLGGRGVAAKIMIDERLTRPALFESLETAHLFHYSGHAILRPDAPERSGLVLPKADAAGQLVTLLDLIGRPTPRLRHATLAACWAADGYVFPGGHSVSFPQLLVKAGVDAVLAPLWEVEDRVLSEFLQTFYAGLASGSRAEALRHAQQYVIGRGYASPYWWAAFQVYGDAGRLRV